MHRGGNGGGQFSAAYSKRLESSVGRKVDHIERQELSLKGHGDSWESSGWLQVMSALQSTAFIEKKTRL